MQYIVIGSDPETGEECKTIVDADGKAEADEKAAALGWLIESVTLMGRPVDELAVAALDYRGPSTPRRGSRAIGGASTGYRDIKMCATVLRIVGSLCIIITLIVFVVGLVQVADEADRRDGEPGRLFLAVLTATAMLAAVAAVLFMMAGVGIAIRDIAHNSFWRPQPAPLPKPTIGEVELELEQRTGESSIHKR